MTRCAVCSGSEHAIARRICCGLTLLASSAEAQTIDQKPATPEVKAPADVVVTGQREPDVLPIAVLDSADIATYGVDSIADLLAAVGPLTRSAAGGEARSS